MSKEICDYFADCPVAKQTGRDCSDADTCQTNKFYQRYGLDYLSLGVGAAMVDPRTLTKEAHCDSKAYNSFYGDTK